MNAVQFLLCQKWTRSSFTAKSGPGSSRVLWNKSGPNNKAGLTPHTDCLSTINELCSTTANDADKCSTCIYILLLFSFWHIALVGTVAIRLLLQAFVCSDHFSQGWSIFCKQKIGPGCPLLPWTHYHVTVPLLWRGVVPARGEWGTN